MPKIILTKAEAKAFSSSERKAFKKIKDKDGGITFEANVVPTSNIQELNQKYEDLKKSQSKAPKGSDKSILPKALRDMSKSEIGDIFSEYTSLKKKAQSGKLKSDKDIEDHIARQVSERLADATQKLKKVKGKYAKAQQDNEDIKRQATRDGRIREVSKAIGKLKGLKVREGLEESLKNQIEKYIPDNPEDNFFLSEERDDEGQLKKLWSEETGGSMNADDLANYITDKVPGFFDPVKGEDRQDLSKDGKAVVPKDISKMASSDFFNLAG